MALTFRVKFQGNNTFLELKVCMNHVLHTRRLSKLCLALYLVSREFVFFALKYRYEFKIIKHLCSFDIRKT